MVLESQLPHKIVNLLYSEVREDNNLTFFCGEFDFLKAFERGLGAEDAAAAPRDTPHHSEQLFLSQYPLASLIQKIT